MAAIAWVCQAQQEHQIKDTIVDFDRTGNYHLSPKRVFVSAIFETRVVHSFATKQYRMPADPGNKTDETDLHAQHRAAVAGFGLCERELSSTYRELQLRSRHRRHLGEKSLSLACQIRDDLHLSMPRSGAAAPAKMRSKRWQSCSRCTAFPNAFDATMAPSSSRPQSSSGLQQSASRFFTSNLVHLGRTVSARVSTVACVMSTCIKRT